ncbi:hypothetical protein [Pseudomonas laurentiana]
MFNHTLLLCAFISLTACSDGVAEHTQRAPTGQQSPVQNILHKNAIYLPSGQDLQVSGQLRRYELQTTDKGLYDRYVFESPDDLMALEGQIYATLAKRGYTRNVRNEKPGLFEVRYVKRNTEPVVMTYETLDNSESAFKTRLKIKWKNS